MAVIRISERATGEAGGGFGVTLGIGDEGEFEASIKPPFEVADEQKLEWYFEEHLRYPFAYQVRAKEAAASIKLYGESLFSQLFAERRANAAYEKVKNAGLGQLRFEITGSPAFHALHWEALKDPELPSAFALDAPMVRKSKTPQVLGAETNPSPTLNLLVVTARPNAERDVGYRTISRPLVEALRQANLKVDVDIVRPGAYRALQQQLEEAGAGHYHVVHFDMHGALMSWGQFQNGGDSGSLTFKSRFGRPDLAQYDGVKGFLFFEHEGEPANGSKADPAEASELSKLLLKYRIPIVILNACQSGKQSGASETSLAAKLLEAGAQTVLGMRYSVTVSAAKLMIPELYRRLFDGKALDEAIQGARRLLCDDKDRRAYFRQSIQLEDWILPVVYQHRRVELKPRPFTDKEWADWLKADVAVHRGPDPAYGFFGRDVDVLRIEKRLLTAGNLLLMHGMGGAGKSTLLHHLCGWWQKTGFVEGVFYFGYDEKAWTRQQVVHAIAEKLYDPGRFHGSFLALSEELQQADLAQTLKSKRHLLILDNLESITGAALAIKNTLPEAEQKKLRSLLAALKGGRTLVLLGSRGKEAWLSQDTFGANVLELGGLDEEAASDLADAILRRYEATKWRGDKTFAELLKLLDGYPLALEVILPNLARQTPAEILEALRTGEDKVDLKSDDKTKSILRCIDYSHGNLSQEAQELLLCLAPFQGMFNKGFVKQYSEQLKLQPELKHLAHERWPEVLEEAMNWGLLSGEDEPSLLRLQPVFPYFLRTRLADPAQAAKKAAIERAFRAHYDGMGGHFVQLLQSKEPEEQRLGFALMGLEYANFTEALRLALSQHAAIRNLHFPLRLFLDRSQDHARGLELGELALRGLDGYPKEALTGEIGADFIGAIDAVAMTYLRLRRHDEAKAAYERSLALIDALSGMPADFIGKGKAGILHQLGRVAEEQRRWPEAEEFYKKALALKVEFNDRYEQASTYHQLGMVAQQQRRWPEAEEFYKKALALYVEFSDRHRQASTYHQLGMVAQQQRRWPEAEEFYKKALALKVEFNDRHSQASTYHQLGIVAHMQRRWPEAEEFYKKALALFVEFNDRHSQASTYHQLGMVAQQQRRWPEAEEFYKKALALFVEFNDRHSQASTYHQLGRVAEEQRRWPEAEEFYKKALALFVEFNDRHSQASTYHNLGVVAEEQRRFAEAADFYLKALTLFVEFQDGHNRAIALRSLARLRQTSGDEGLTGKIAQALGMDLEEAAKLLDSAVGNGGAEE